MAGYAGCLFGEVTGFPETTKDGGVIVRPPREVRGQQPLTPADVEPNRDNSDACKFVRVVPVMTPKGLCGDNHDRDIANEYLYGRVWFFPNDINAGFITSEQTHYVYAWNAHPDKSVTVSSFSEVNTDGTTLNYITPYTLGIYQEIEWTLTISTEGPSTQNAYYRPTIDGTVYELHIIGSRLLWVTPEPNWDVNPKIIYGFQTAKSSNRLFVEQRRPLLVEPRRRFVVQYLVTEREAQEVFNTFSYGHDKILAVPVYNEKMFATSLAAGLTRIVFTESHEYNWNFNNICEHIILVDHWNRVATVEEIDNIDTTTSVEITAGLGATFDVNTTVVYPSIPCIIKSTKWQEHTENVFLVDVEFEEFWLSG